MCEIPTLVDSFFLHCSLQTMQYHPLFSSTGSGPLTFSTGIAIDNWEHVNGYQLLRYEVINLSIYDH